MSRALAAVALALLSAPPGCGGSPPPSAPTPPAGVRFAEVAERSGILYRNRTGDPEKKRLTEMVGGGTTFFDADGDGDPDLFVSNGWREGGFPEGERPRKAFFRNDGGGRFADATEEAGLQSEDWNMGCAAADFDGDGDADLFVTNLGPGRLYRNDGRGRFADVAPRLGLDSGPWGTAGAFGDADRDGDLDLYVAHYIDWDPAYVPTDRSSCRYKDLMVGYGPRGFPGAADRYYRNEGDGLFTEASEACGLRDAEKGFGFQALFADEDGDGDPDLFVANDSVPNLLFHNRGDGSFEEVGFEAGIALSADGRAQAGMGACFGDFDGDLRLDLVVTNFSDDNDNLFRNEGSGFFTDISHSAGIAGPSFPRLAWAALPIDADLDGALDLFVANGHLYPQVDRVPLDTSYAQACQLFRNRGDGAFEEVAERSGLGEKRVWRGASVADVDADGDADLFVTAIDGPAALFRNDTAPRGRFLAVALAGVRSNREGVGARVTVRAGGREQVREVAAGVGFCGGVELALLFGIGEAARVDRLEVCWPSGSVQALEGILADTRVRVVER